MGAGEREGDRDERDCLEQGWSNLMSGLHWAALDLTSTARLIINKCQASFSMAFTWMAFTVQCGRVHGHRASNPGLQTQPLHCPFRRTLMLTRGKDMDCSQFSSESQGAISGNSGT